MKIKRYLATITTMAVISGVLAVVLAVPAFAATTLVVNEANANSWTVTQHDTCGSSTTGSQRFMDGPITPPAPIGSREFTVGTDGDSFEAFGTTSLAGVTLASLTKLSYATFVTTQSTGGGDQQAPYLSMRIDYTGDGVYDDRLFFEPAYQTGSYSGDPVPNQGTIIDGTWQTWDALAGGWWAENDNSGGPPLHTLAQFATDHPGATIVNAPNAGLRIVAGCGGGAWQGFVGNADNVQIGVNGNDTTYNFEHTDTLGSCAVAISGSNPVVYTLLADCTTDHTIVVPQNVGGSTFNGNGFSITGVDPTGGHFLGAVLQAQPGTDPITVENTSVTVSSLADACDAGGDRLRGILFDGVSGTIDLNTVTDLEQGTSGLSGCQEGNGIDVRNTSGVGQPNVTISNNTVTDYQKTGIIATGMVAATMTLNTVTGDGSITYIAQNGIQVSFGATANLNGNHVSLNYYSPRKVTACGLLIYKAGGVSSASGNGISNVKADNAFVLNEKNICNFGKGGGFSPNA